MSATEQLLARRHRQPAFVVCSILVVGFFALYPILDWVLRGAGITAAFGFWDFGAYGGGVHRWFRGEAIYQRAADGSFHGSYLYPPIGLLLFVPFALLPFTQGVMLWSIFSLGALWIALQLVARAYSLQLSRWERVFLLWLLLGFQPVIYGLKMGQVTVLLGALVTLSLAGLLFGQRSDHRSARYLSGAAITAAAAVKPFYAVGGGHLLMNRDRLLGSAVTVAGLLVGSFVLFGIETHLRFVEVLLWGKGWGTDPRPLYLWMPSQYQPLHAVASISLPLRFAGVVSLALLSALASDRGEHAVFAACVAAIPLLGPTVHTYDLVVLLPAAIALVALELDRDGVPAIPVVALFLVNVHAYGMKLLFQHLPQAPPSAFLRSLAPIIQPGLWGPLLLLGVALFRAGEAIPHLHDRVRPWSESQQ